MNTAFVGLKSCYCEQHVSSEAEDILRGRTCLNGLRFARDPHAAALWRTSMRWRCSPVSSSLWAKKKKMPVKIYSGLSSGCCCLDTRAPLEMFYNFVQKKNNKKMISRVKYGQWSIQDVRLSRTDVSLRNTAAFRPLLLFRLHAKSHQALAFFSQPLARIWQKTALLFPLTYAVLEAHTESSVWTLCVIIRCCVCRQMLQCVQKNCCCRMTMIKSRGEVDVKGQWM